MARCGARAWHSGGCCAVTPLPAEAWTPSLPFRHRRPRKQYPPPTNHYHRKSGGHNSCLFERQDVSFARNSQSQSSDAGARRQRQRRRYALHYCLHDADPRRIARLSVLRSNPLRAPPAQSQSQPAQTASASQQATQRPLPGQAQLPAASAQAVAATPSIGASIESDTTVENELYKIVFTNRGARVKHWILKKYTDTAGKPLDMVQPQARRALRVSALALHLSRRAGLHVSVEQCAVPIDGGRRAAFGYRPRARSHSPYVPLCREWTRCGEDLPVRFQLRGLD